MPLYPREYSPGNWWVNNVLPLVYDDSLSYYEVLAKLRYYLENTVWDVKRLTQIVDNIEGIGDVEQFTEMLNRINAKIGELEDLKTANKDDIVSAINGVVLDMGVMKLEIDDKYTKPETGIPESDLSDELKEKINEQFEQDKNYNNLNNKPKINHIVIEGDHEPGYYGIGTYNKPENGIPESDLAQGIVDKLNETSDNTDKIDGIAPSVSTFTADRKYEVGELVFIGGTLYKVIKTVYEGNPFQIGNNIEETTINNELEDIITEIGKLKVEAGAESYDMDSGVLQTVDKNVYTLFFRYFYAKAGEDYLFIVIPASPNVNNSGYNINIYNENGDVAYTFNSGNNVEDYKNERRFTFTPSVSGNYYCGIKKDTNGTSYSVVQTVKLQYTPSQAGDSLVQMVSELIPRVEDVEGDIAGLENAVVGAIKYAEYNGGTVAGNQTYNTFCRIPSTRDITDLPGTLGNYARVVYLLTVGNGTNRLQVIFNTVMPNRGISYRIMNNSNWLEWKTLPDEYSLYPTGDTTNRSSDFVVYARDYNKHIKLAPGDYYIRSITMLEGEIIEGAGADNTRIICTTPANNYKCAIKMVKNCTIKNVSIVLLNGFDDTNKPTDNYFNGVSGILIGSDSTSHQDYTLDIHCQLENVNISGFTGCGLMMRHTTNGVEGNRVNNVRIDHCSCGIYLGHHSEFNMIDQSYITYCYTAAIIMGGNNIISDSFMGFNEVNVNLKDSDSYDAAASNDGHGIINDTKMVHTGWVSGVWGDGESESGAYSIIRNKQSSAMLVSNSFITGPIYAKDGGQALTLAGCHLREYTNTYADHAIVCMSGCFTDTTHVSASVKNGGKIFRRACMTYLGVELGDVL